MVLLKKVSKKLLPHFLQLPLQAWNIKRQVTSWHKQGSPLPPPYIVKQATVQWYQKKYGCNTLIETGTFKGDMVEAQRMRFSKIISIELGQQLFENAKERFKRYSHIEILQGDSGKVLPMVMQTINTPAVFWLDGHYSQGITAKGDLECPILEELSAILKAPLLLPHVLLIDDARDFNGNNDYPTIDALEKYVKNINNAYELQVKDDIIRFAIPQ